MWWWAGDGDVISCDGDGKKRCRGLVIVMGEKKQKWNSKCWRVMKQKEEEDKWLTVER